MRRFCLLASSGFAAAFLVLLVVALAITSTAAMANEHYSPYCSIDGCHCETHAQPCEDALGGPCFHPNCFCEPFQDDPEGPSYWDCDAI